LNLSCILVKKNDDGGLVYYKIDSDYKEGHYFEQLPQGQRLKIYLFFNIYGRIL